MNLKRLRLNIIGIPQALIAIALVVAVTAAFRTRKALVKLVGRSW